MKKLIAIVGPTAVGKSRLALQLAQTLDAEIVSADSRQVYRHMDIGTAKPSKQELALVRHHLIDIVNPDEDFSLAQYQQLAGEAVEDIIRRGKLPLLIGGSGQYVWAMVEGWGIPRVPPDPALRQELEEKAAAVGSEELYRRLERINPAAAAGIDRFNTRRVIRALEVTRNKNIAPQPSKSARYDSLIIGLTLDRAELYNKIDTRVDKMIELGLVKEVSGLVKKGYRLELPSMSGIGYKQIGEYLAGKTTLEAAVQQVKFESHRYVRQQYNWFSPKDGRIRWFDARGGRVAAEIAALIAEFISKG